MKKSLLLAVIAGSFATFFGGSLALAQDSTQPAPAPRRSPFGTILDQIMTTTTRSATGTSAGSGFGLSSAEIGQGLKEALRVGVEKGANQASAIDGYFANALIKLAVPPEAQNMASKMRQLGFGRQVDQFELSLNRAAEGAAKRARPIFWSAITQMTIPDAVNILRGQPDAATQYLRRTSGQQLVTAFTPVIDSTLKSNNATRYYNDLANTYNRLPFVQKVNPSLTNYATNRAVDGLFVLVAQEEKKIRENPAARISDLLKRVFGSR
jgi:hypothetical protein